MYSGHKRCLGIKFPSVVTPDGFFASMFGWVCGNRHNSFLLLHSGLLHKLQEFMLVKAPEHIDAVIHSLCGDTAYTKSIHTFWWYRNPADGSAQVHWNCPMSKVCEVAERCFANITAQWSNLDFRVAIRIFQSPVLKYLIVAALLVNIWTYFYGNQTMKYFHCEATIYLSMIK